MINPFDDFPSERIRLCKKSGEVVEEIEALFDPVELQIHDTSLEIEEGDIFERTLPNGRVEMYEIIQCDYFSGTTDFPPAYDCKIRKLKGLHTSAKSTANKGNFVNQTNGKNVFLFITANEHEREAFEKKFIRQKEQYILGKTYYLGIFGCYPAAYIHMDEQGVTAAAAMPLVSELVRELHPVAVVMVGIAFGANESTQKIGDVLISEKILPHDSRKVLEDKTIYKESPKEVGFQLLNAFREHREWIHHLPNSECSIVHVGAILTGSPLINNYDYRTQLLKDFATYKPIGGEMEAQGLYTMCRIHGIPEWMIVKGICDWAYNKNNPNKEKDQIIAANAAVNYCFHVFSRDGVFGSLVSKKQEIVKKDISNTMIQTGNNGVQIGQISNGTVTFNMGSTPLNRENK